MENNTTEGIAAGYPAALGSYDSLDDLRRRNDDTEFLDRPTRWMVATEPMMLDEGLNRRLAPDF